MSERKKPTKVKQNYTPVIDTSEVYKPKDPNKFNPETEMRADLWDTMSLQQLWQQKILLNNRITYMQQLPHKHEFIQQLLRGMGRLEMLIEEKGKDEAVTVFLGRT